MENSQVSLNQWHKRQATLLYHFTSMKYLQGLLPRIDKLIAMANGFLDDRASLDVLGMAVGGWQPLHTAAHFSTHAFPALVDFREGALRSIAMRSSQRYGTLGEMQCGRMLDEYGNHMLWSTPDQERVLRDYAESTFRYAAKVSSVAGPLRSPNDFWFWLIWNESHVDRHKIPRFRVRTDIVATSDQVPPCTGVYVAKDDPYAALQFAWTGGYGELYEARTLNEFGRKLAAKVGRGGLWGDEAGLHEALGENQSINPEEWSSVTPLPPGVAASLLASEAFEKRSCEWYFVEMIEGEFEEIDGTYSGSSNVDLRPERVPAGRAVPVSGWWYTPAQGSRRYFKQGEVFPEIAGSDWGSTFWLWASDQAAPRIG